MPIPFYVSNAVDTAARSANKAALAINVVNGQPIEPSTINNAVIGGANPAAASFTTVSSTGLASFASLGVVGDSYLDGNVGIGNITPTAKLDVTGSIKSSASISGVSLGITGTSTLGATTWGASAAFTYGTGSAANHLAALGVGPNNIVTETTIARTLSLTDAGKYIIFTNAGAITLTVPTQATVAWPVGSEIYVRRDTSAGVITLAGVTVTGGGGSEDVPADGNFALKNITTDVWHFI